MGHNSSARNDVTFIAPATIRRSGEGRDPSGDARRSGDAALPVVEDPTNYRRIDDLVILAVKSQDTTGALRHLAQVAPASTAIVCAQNGVENERMALRIFQHVYGMCVMCPLPTSRPRVQANSAPVTVCSTLAAGRRG